MDLVKSLFRDNKKRIIAVFLIFALGIGVILFSSGKEKETKTEESLAEYKANLESELAELCSSVRGVGRCRVSVSFSRGAENISKGSLLIETKPPSVLGVIIVCKGADSDAVRRDLTELITSLFAISSTRVAILKLS